MAIRKHAATLLVTSFLLLVVTGMKVWTDEKQTIDPHRIIRFDYPNQIKETNLNQKRIGVFDEKGKKIEAFFVLTEDRKSILLHPPENGYKQKETYQVKLPNKKSYVFSIEPLTSGQVKDVSVINFSEKNE